MTANNNPKTTTSTTSFPVVTPEGGQWVENPNSRTDETELTVYVPTEEELDITRYHQNPPGHLAPEPKDFFGLQRDQIFKDLETRYSKYIPPEGSPLFLKLGGLYKRNGTKTPDWAVSANGGLGGQTPSSYVHRSLTDTHPTKLSPGDLVLCLTSPTLEQPFQKVLRLRDEKILQIYVVEGMMTYWDLVSEPVAPGGEDYEKQNNSNEEKEAPEAGDILPV